MLQFPLRANPMTSGARGGLTAQGEPLVADPEIERAKPHLPLAPLIPNRTNHSPVKSTAAVIMPRLLPSPRGANGAASGSMRTW